MPFSTVSFDSRVYAQLTHRDHQQLRRTKSSHSDNDFLRCVDVDELSRRLIREGHSRGDRCPVTALGELNGCDGSIVEDIEVCAGLDWKVECSIA